MRFNNYDISPYKPEPLSSYQRSQKKGQRGEKKSLKTQLKRIGTLAGFCALVAVSGQASGAAFDACPTNGFLMQGSPAKLYSVDLATGFTETLASDLGTSSTLNAVAFNLHDNYLYGFSNEYKNLVRIHNDYSIENLNLSGMPATSFYVGDTSVTENVYYFYRPGASYGLYKVSLDVQSPDYGVISRIRDGSSLSLAIYDFASHPINNYLYAVDKQGNLHRIESETGNSAKLGNVGVTGVFGASYFDEQGTLYISRNADGFIFRIDVSVNNPTAEFFANGPQSSQNDGARCATATLISEQSTIDFGDAPDSYGTTLESNGARHMISEDLYLGVSAGGDDNGVTQITGFEQSLDAVVQVEATGVGYLNVWADWDQNGQFDNSDHAVIDQAMVDGANIVAIDVPADAVLGQTWVRARYSSTQGIGPTGGVSDGEVEDFQVVVTEQGTSIIVYPGSNEYTTLAYEDKWPKLGDYDMNDVVVAYRTYRYLNDGLVTRYAVEGRVLAVGAGYKNGFAIQLDGIATGNINTSAMRFELNGISQISSALETNADSDDAVLVVSQNLWDQVDPISGCTFYRSEKGCDETNQLTFYISAPLVNPVDPSQAPMNVLNPFIFATPNTYHGLNYQPGRGLEVHLKNKAVSARFDSSLLATHDDSSSYPLSSFVTANGMPWALELPALWDHPVEKVDLVSAYPEFADFVTSGGSLKKSWYLNPASEQKIILNFNQMQD